MGRATPRRVSPSRVPVEIDTAALRGQFRGMRAARGLSQAAAAALLGVSQATISAFESGKFAAVRDATLLAIRALVGSWQGAGDTARTSPLPRIVVVEPPADAPGGCVWCGSPLPQMDRQARFCPTCGGRQSPPEPAAGAPDARARCCVSCGRPREAPTRRKRD